LFVRDERALRGANVRWSRTLTPKGFYFLGWADGFRVTLRRRDGRRLRRYAKDFLEPAECDWPKMQTNFVGSIRGRFRF
jgi:hypothetical protein